MVKEKSALKRFNGLFITINCHLNNGKKVFFVGIRLALKNTLHS